MNWPRGRALLAVLVAVAVWIGALGGLAWAWWAVVAAVPVAMAGVAASRLRPESVAIGLALIAGALSGSMAADRTTAALSAELPVGRVDLRATALTDVEARFGERRVIVRPQHLVGAAGQVAWDGPPLEVILPAGESPPEPRAGESLRVVGSVHRAPFLIRDLAVAGTLRATHVRILGSGTSLHVAGNALRSRVQTVLAESSSPEAALLRGFLVGDVSELSAIDQEAMRRSGLSHFVAVSGSNVALFLVVWWLVLLPFGVGPRRRALLGIVGVAVFVVATRWEPSVVRAGAMAVLVLGARLVGYPLDGWTALSVAVTVLVAISGDLAASLGFQLSVAATAGLLVGSGVLSKRRPRWLWATLGATAAAQVAVAPLLLMRFGEIPAGAPLANVVAAPMVAAATAVGASAAVIGHPVLVVLAEIPAGAVLWVAHSAAAWPQLGVPASLVAGVGIVGLTRRRSRSLVIAVGTAAVLLTVVSAAVGTDAPPHPIVTFLDVGQGDATLLRGTDGSVVLVDGGRDPAVLADALRRYRVDAVDLLVATHGDDDHVGGLAELPGRFDVGTFWYPDHPDNSDALQHLAKSFDPAAVPRAGTTYRVGEFEIVVLGPARRYADVNDGSVVLSVAVAGGPTVLLTGDIEAVAQHDLGPPLAEILKVPHHGSLTSDLDWLEESAATIAVVSVGPNTFGHPRPEVLDALTRSGAEVRRTDESGDISISLAP